MALRIRLTEAAVASCLCAVALTGCGGGSGGASGASPASDDRATVLEVDAGAATVPRAWHLYVPDTAHASIAVSDTLHPEAGGLFAAASIKAGGALGANLQVDPARDELYAIVGHTVGVYATADSLASRAGPARGIALPASLRTPRALYLDVANDLLYVGGETAAGDGEILVYASAHTATGMSVKPARLMVIEGGLSFFTVDPLRQRLYAVNAVAGVHVFANADSASGTLVDTATIPVTGTGLALDPARDRLYVADPFAGLILVDAASSAAPIVTATLSIDDARYVAIDSATDRAYVSALGSLYVIDNASELTAATVLDAPAVSSIAGTSLGTASVR